MQKKRSRNFGACRKYNVQDQFTVVCLEGGAVGPNQRGQRRHTRTGTANSGPNLLLAANVWKRVCNDAKPSTNLFEACRHQLQVPGSNDRTAAAGGLCAGPTHWAATASLSALHHCSAPSSPPARCTDLFESCRHQLHIGCCQCRVVVVRTQDALAPDGVAWCQLLLQLWVFDRFMHVFHHHALDLQQP